MKGPVVVCAASRPEARACAQGIADAGLSGELEVLETGVGLENARAALASRLSKGPQPRLVVSSGYAGAFSEELPLHSWVTSDEVVLFAGGTATARFTTRPFSGPVPAARLCRLATSDELVLDHQQLARQYGALRAPVAVDMETAALAAECDRVGVPLSVFRLVTDTPRAPLPSFLFPVAAAMTRRGMRSRLSLGLKGVRGALRDPAGVLRLARDSAEWGRLLRDGWRQNAEILRLYGEKVDLGAE